MAFQASLRLALFYFLVAFDAGPMGGSVRAGNHLLVDNVTVTVDAFELRLLNVQPMGNSNIPVNFCFLLHEIPMTNDAVLIDEFVLGEELVGEYLTGFGVTIDTGHSGRMNRLAPHHNPGLFDVAMETDGGVGHENMSRENNKGYPQNDHSRKDTKEKPFPLDEIEDGPLNKVSDFHGSDSSSILFSVPGPSDFLSH